MFQEYRYQVPGTDVVIQYYEERLSTINKNVARGFGLDSGSKRKVIGISNKKGFVDWANIDPTKTYSHAYLSNATGYYGESLRGCFSIGFSESLGALAVSIFGFDDKSPEALTKFCLARVGNAPLIWLHAAQVDPSFRTKPETRYRGLLTQAMMPSFKF